jgi:two-component system cell cycle sensor histidine kinase/response regulator CckA
MAQETLSIESATLVKSESPAVKGSLAWKMAAGMAALIVVVSTLMGGLSYVLLGQALNRQADQRAYLLAANLGDAIAGHLLKRNLLEVHAFVAKYGRLEGVAYVFVQDSKGEIVAHSLKSFPAELKPAASSAPRDVERRSVSYQRSAVRETAVPLLEGQLGTVHIGLWADPVSREARPLLKALVGASLAVILLGLLAAYLLARRFARPLQALSAVAARISTGDLETPVQVQGQDEIGELARSVERMRTSLKAAMWRLSRS